MTRRGTSNSNSRGGSKDRRIRKQWLLDNFGDGVSAPCSFGCGVFVTFETITVDRFPIAGIDGGTYKRGNIRPACGACNSADGSAKGHERRRKREEEKVMSSEIPQPCENECIMHLVDPPCSQCEAYYIYWAEVDDSELEMDWSQIGELDK